MHYAPPFNSLLAERRPWAGGTWRIWALLNVGLPAAIGFLLGANRTGMAAYLPWEQGVAFWVGLALVSWQVFGVLSLGFGVALQRFSVHASVALGLGAIAGSFLLRPVIYSYAAVFADDLAAGRALRTPAEIEFSAAFIIQHFEQWIGAVGLWIAINLLLARVTAAPSPGVPAPTAEAPPAEGRLPTGVAAEVIALKAEDHYVRVYTPRGEHLVLTRLSDAIRELGHVEGARVHRSYWVSRRAVAKVASQGRTRVIHLSNGLQVPVSQTYKEGARQAGLPL